MRANPAKTKSANAITNHVKARRSVARRDFTTVGVFTALCRGSIYQSRSPGRNDLDGRITAYPDVTHFGAKRVGQDGAMF